MIHQAGRDRIGRSDEEAEEEEEDEEQPPPPYPPKLYPALPVTRSAAKTTPRTSRRIQNQKKLKNSARKYPKVQKYANLDESEDSDLICPMIEMPNPNAGAADQPPTVWVYRAWTIRDMKSVTADISHPREGPEDCTLKLRLLANSFHPNAAEFEVCVRLVVGVECRQVAETGNSLDLNNTPLSSSEDINEMYPAQ